MFEITRLGIKRCLSEKRGNGSSEAGNERWKRERYREKEILLEESVRVEDKNERKRGSGSEMFLRNCIAYIHY